MPEVLRSNGMIVGQRYQIEAERLQGFQRSRRRKKLAVLARFTFGLIDSGGFEVGELHVALQQRFNHRHCRRCVSADVRPDHRLSGQRDAEPGRPRPSAPSQDDARQAAANKSGRQLNVFRICVVLQAGLLKKTGAVSILTSVQRVALHDVLLHWRFRQTDQVRQQLICAVGSGRQLTPQAQTRDRSSGPCRPSLRPATRASRPDCP